MPSVPFSVTDGGLAIPAHLLDDVFTEQHHTSRKTLITSAGRTAMHGEVRRLIKIAGQVAEARVNDFGVAMEIEHPDHQDALVRPRRSGVAMQSDQIEV